MQKTIRGKVYDTENATWIAGKAEGMYGDPNGYEERLYCNPEGFYFLYAVGGETSPYPSPIIRAVSKVKALEWAAQNAD